MEMWVSQILYFHVTLILHNAIDGSCVNATIFFTKFYLYKYSYKFDTVLYQFLETGNSDGTLKGLNQLLKYMGFSLIPPLIFLYRPLNIW